MNKYIYDGYSDIGQRQNNEDAFLMCEVNGGYLFIVADGLGGHDCGEVASSLAVKVIQETVQDTGDIGLGIKKANQIIFEKNQNSSYKMLTTIAVVYIHDHQTIISHVGDTRIYVFQNGKIIFQSQDHSVSQMSVIVGEITTSQIRQHQDRNKLTKVLGAKKEIKVDVKNINHNYDALLLCTDGFWEYVLENDMEILLGLSNRPDQWLIKMKKVLEKNKQIKNDNNTAIAVLKKEAC